MHTEHYIRYAREGGPSAEYFRKLAVAGEIADDAYVAGGLDGIRDELCDLRHADPVIVAELERLYHRQILRTASTEGRPS